MTRGFLGIDVGSVTTKLVVIDDEAKLLASLYTRTLGKPVAIVQAGLREIVAQLNGAVQIMGAGVTGSARQLIGRVIEADLVKNEITAHAVGATHCCRDAQTVIEIGGQDSKVIILRNGVVTDFAMNTVCAAGTGSFLDQQANRLGIPIERFGELALESKTPVRIAGRCTVFAESDIIFKQQAGVPVDEIVKGLCLAMVRNFLADVGHGKKIRGPVLFQGGVAANSGIVAAFESELGMPVIVPPHHGVMGALGIALLARSAMRESGMPSRMRPFSDISKAEFRSSVFECEGCANRCEIVRFEESSTPAAFRGGRCGRWALSVSHAGLA